MLSKPRYTIGNIKIYGNNHNVPLVYWYELTDREKENFDYIDNPDDNFTGFRYKGWVYDLGEFMRTERELKGFDGYVNDTYFSGILVKYNEDDNDFIRVYTFYAE